MYDIRRIGKKGIDVKEELDISIPRAFGAGEQSIVSFVGRLTNVGASFILDGEANCILATYCSRCLKSCETTVNFKVLENFVEAGTMMPDECDIVFDDETISIFPAIERNLLSNIPFQFLCNGECAGLCSSCGVDLNHTKCDCADRPQGAFADLLADLK